MRILIFLLISTFCSGQINVRDFGALGDGSDQTVAIQAVLDYATAGGPAKGKSTTQRRTIIFPEGDYLISSPLVIRPQGEDTSVRNIRFVGEGSNNIQPSTRLIFDIDTPDTSGLTIVSGFAIDFYDMTIRNQQDLRSMIRITADTIPYFSGTSMRFDRVHFSPFAIANCTEAAVEVYNSKLVEFIGCWFTVGSTDDMTCVRIGDDDSNWPNTFQEGVTHNTVLRDCFIFGRIDVRNGKQWVVDGCVFAEAEYAVVSSTGDKRMQAGRITNTIFVGDTEQTSITLGNYDPGTSAAERAGGIVIENCEFRDQKVAINVDSIGYVRISGNEFFVRRSGDIGVIIPSTAKEVHIDNTNNFDLAFRNDCISIQDDRKTNGDLMANVDIFACEYLTSNYATTTTSFEQILNADSLKITGGMYEICYNVQARNGATGQRARVKVEQVYNDGTTYSLPINASRYLESTDDANIYQCAKVYLHPDIKEDDAQSSIRLWFQGESASAVTIRGGGDASTLGRTWLQVTKL